MIDILQRMFVLEPIPLGAVMTASIPLLLFVLGYLRARRENLQRYTLDVLMRYSHSPELLKSLHRLRTHAGDTAGNVTVDAALEAELALTMPHFAAIALASNKGLLDHDIIVQARYASMQSIWTSYGQWLKERARQLGRPLLYDDLEEFLARNAAEYERYSRRRSAEGRGASPAA